MTRNKSFLLEKNKSIFLILFTVSIIFIPSLFITFFGDEIAFIQRNEFHSLTDIFSLFTKLEFHQDYYRPVGNLFAGIFQLVFGYKVIAYRIINLCIHLINVFLLYKFSMRLFADQSYGNAASLFAALAFGIFPLNDLAVIWHTDLFDRLMFTFYMGSIYTFIKNYKPSSASIILFLMSLLTKEMAFSLPLLIIVLTYNIKERNAQSAIIKSFPYFAAAGLVIIFRFVLLNNNLFAINDAHSSNGIFIILKNYIYFGGMLIFPFFSYSIQSIVKEYHYLFIILGVLFAAVPVYFLIKNKKYQRTILFFAGIVFITILPVSRLLMKWYLYLPSAFFTLLLSYIIFRVLPSNQKIKTIIYSVVLLFYSVSIVLTQLSWVMLTHRSDKIISEFISSYGQILTEENELSFLTIPAKIENYPVNQLNFEAHLNFYLPSRKKINVYSRSNLNSYLDIINFSASDSVFVLSHTGVNYFILFGYEKNNNINRYKFKDGLARTIIIKKNSIPNQNLYYFTNGKFIRIVDETN